MTDRVQQDLSAWRQLVQHHLPDWRPTLQQLQRLDEGPHELTVALRSLARGWDKDDARWDVLMAVLEYCKRQHAHELAEQQRAALEGVLDRWFPNFHQDAFEELINVIDPAKRATTSKEPTP